MQCAQRIDGVHLSDVLTLNLNGRTGEELLLLNTVTYNYDIFNHIAVFYHYHADRTCAGNSHVLRDIANVGEFQHCTNRNVHSELTISVRSNCVSCTLFDYVYTRKGALVSTTHDCSFNRHFLTEST